MIQGMPNTKIILIIPNTYYLGGLYALTEKGELLVAKPKKDIKEDFNAYELDWKQL